MLIATDGTGYTTIARDDGTYGVEVVRPGEMPEIIRGFISEADAERWIMTKVAQRQLGDLPNIIAAGRNPQNH